MTISRSRAAALTLRRLPPAAMLAAAMLAGSAAAVPPTASAREFDAGQYDNCLDGLAHSLMAGDITDGQFVDLHQQCCRLADGDWTPRGGGGLGTCGAPPAIAASTSAGPPPPSATKPPATTSPTKAPKTTFTLAPIAPVA